MLKVSENIQSLQNLCQKSRIDEVSGDRIAAYIAKVKAKFQTCNFSRHRSHQETYSSSKTDRLLQTAFIYPWATDNIRPI